MTAKAPRAAGTVIAIALSAALGGGGATPAVAEETAQARFEACLAKSNDRDGDKTCLYIVSDACSAREDDSTNTSDVACLVAGTEAWDGVLNTTWPLVRDKAAQADAGDQGARGANMAALLKAQHAWIAFRDAECAYAYQRFYGGTIRNLMAASCQLEMTAGRAMEFRDWLRDGN